MAVYRVVRARTDTFGRPTFNLDDCPFPGLVHAMGSVGPGEMRSFMSGGGEPVWEDVLPGVFLLKVNGRHWTGVMIMRTED